MWTHRHLGADAVVGRSLAEVGVDLLKEPADIEEQFLGHSGPELADMRLRLVAVNDAAEEEGVREREGQSGDTGPEIVHV